MAVCIFQREEGMEYTFQLVVVIDIVENNPTNADKQVWQNVISHISYHHIENSKMQ